jgi:hypothetical protein
MMRATGCCAVLPALCCCTAPTSANSTESGALCAHTASCTRHTRTPARTHPPTCAPEKVQPAKGWRLLLGPLRLGSCVKERELIQLSACRQWGHRSTVVRVRTHAGTVTAAAAGPAANPARTSGLLLPPAALQAVTATYPRRQTAPDHVHVDALR